MVDSTSTAGEQAVAVLREKIAVDAGRIEEDVLYSSKAHFITAHFWNRFHFWTGLALVALSAIAGASFLGKHEDGSLVAGVLSLAVVVLSAISTFVNGSERSTNHHTAGAAYDAVRCQIRIFRTIECTKPDPDPASRAAEDARLTVRLLDFADQRARLNNGSPAFPNWAYRAAKKSVEAGEATHKGDDGPVPK